MDEFQVFYFLMLGLSISCLVGGFVIKAIVFKNVYGGRGMKGMFHKYVESKVLEKQFKINKSKTAEAQEKA